MRQHAILRAGLIAWGILVAASSQAGPYRDKHGNVAQLTLTTPLVGAPLNGGIHFTVPYLAQDSDGGKTGQYQITSQMSAGRGSSNDFVLHILVTDDRSHKGAELVIRSHATTAPLAPIVRLLDCSSFVCTEDKRIENDEWGAFVIQDRADIANYPLELLDAHASLQLLAPAVLAALPNATAGSGNWAEIMQHHQTLLEEAKFRGDIDFLGATQSDTLTSRMISETALNGGALIQEHALMIHHALTFLTDHDRLIEKLSSALTSKYSWNNYSFPFGRLPAWLINSERTHTPSNFDPLPQFWDRVQNPTTGALRRAGCFHLFPEAAFVPTLSNGSTNLGQYVCDPSPAAADGFVDRRCDQPGDYFRGGIGGLDSDMEATWHDPIHGFLGGEFAPMGTTAGTAAFWPFHVFASSIVLANWRYAQTRNMPTPVSNIDPASLIDINLLVDLSGSFGDDLPNFKSQVPALIDGLAAQYGQIKFSLGGFQDYPIAPFGSAASGDVAYERLVDFNDENDPDNNAGVVKNAIANLTVRSGDDNPQSQLAALFQTVKGDGEVIAAPNAVASIPSGQQVHFRQQATKIILLFTDAAFHSPGDLGSPPATVPYPGPTFDQTVAAILSIDPPMVIGMSSGGGGIPDLQRMAAATGAVAPAGGADCDDDGVVDVPAGAPLVCATSGTSTGIGNVLSRVIDSAITEAKAKDTDADGLPDLADDCPNIANLGQADLDNDSSGDACDPDDDGDGITDANDNCPASANHDQLDTDGDLIGDACDSDDDNDAILDAQDPCPRLSTPNVIRGTSRSDRLIGTAGNDLILGLGGGDTIDGRGGNDCLVGGPGSDRILGGNGNDILSGNEGNDELDGQAGNDLLLGESGNDQLVGGEGDDRLEGGSGNDRLDGDLPFPGDYAAYAQIDEEALHGPAPQVGGDDELSGGEGNDLLFGEGGKDHMMGGPGNDILAGMDGEDEMIGGPGEDLLAGGNDNDAITGNEGDDQVSGGPGDDTLDGGMGSDLLLGNSGDDYLFGGFHMMHDHEAELDSCLGGTGNNTLVNCEQPMVLHEHGSDVQELEPPVVLPAPMPTVSCTVSPRGTGSENRQHGALALSVAGAVMLSIVRRKRRHHHDS